MRPVAEHQGEEPADYFSLAGGRRILQHDCTTCCHRAVARDSIPAGLGTADSVAASATDGVDPTQRDEDDEQEEDSSDYVNMWVVDGITIGPIVSYASRFCARQADVVAPTQSCAQIGCANAPVNYRSVSGETITLAVGAVRMSLRDQELQDDGARSITRNSAGPTSSMHPAGFWIAQRDSYEDPSFLILSFPRMVRSSRIWIRASPQKTTSS